ncbi:MAG: HAD family phosphatase [Vicinamibacterales bacterium]|nr:HAD family phosphatase [Vicinamibacterales bacterium]
MSAPRVLLFDLAGVILDFRGVESLHELSGGRVGREAVFRFWSVSPWADRLHRGVCSPEEFAEGAVNEFSLSIAPQDFLAAFRGWCRGPYPGAFELLDSLRPLYRVACLSNTDELHVEQFRTFAIHEHFDECFFSNEIGLRKPDPACYLYAARALDVLPEDIAFFDDNNECVEGATAVGMRAHQVLGCEALKAKLEELTIVAGRNSATR